MKANQTIVASLAGAALLVTLVTATSFSAFRQIETAAEARKQAHFVLQHADDFLSAIRDAETGQRGFLLTGDEAFLEPYLFGRDTVRADLGELRRLASGSAGNEMLDTLAPLVDAKLAEMARTIDLRRHDEKAAVEAVVRDGEGKRLMDSIRSVMSNFNRIVDGEYAKRDGEFQSNMRQLFSLITAACLLTLLFAVSCVYWIARESKQRLKDLVHLETRHLLEMQRETSDHLREAHASLRISTEKLAVTLISIGDGVIATDAKGRVTLINPVAEKLTGWTQAEAANQPVEAIFHVINQQTRKPSTIPVQRALAQGTTHGLANDTVLISRDGSECAIADSCAPIRDNDGQVIGAVLVFRDVTEEFASQQALREGASQIQAILNAVVDGIITLRVGDGIVETANPAAERIFGYSSAELIGRHVSLVIPEAGQGPDGGILESCAGNGVASTGVREREVAGRRKDGGVFPLELATSEMWIGDQRQLTVILRDITSRERAEQALLKGEALQSAIFNSANFSSIATDAKGVIQIFNVGAERMLGYAAADVVNKITPADISDPQEVIARARSLSVELSMPIAPGFEALVFKASRGIEDIYELTYIRKDGSRFPAVVSVTALRDAQEAIIGYLLIGTDNTARKQIEAERGKLDQRLRDQQFYTRSLIESNIDAIMTTDPFGIITDVNKQMETLTGSSRDELIGAPFKKFFTDPERAQMGINQVLSEREITDYELTARNRDGRETVVSCNATTFYDRDRKLQGVFAAARDVTERNRLGHALQEKNFELEYAKAVAEKANLAKSEFLSSMSHELRSPLNAILGFAQLMELDSVAATTAQKESITQILQSGWHLLKLINEILDLAKVESRHATLSQEPVSLAEVIGECQMMLEPMAQVRGIRLTYSQPDIPRFVHGDRTRIKQVLINLLTNAIKYNTEHGTVEVECSESTPGSTRVSISDTGSGLTPEQVAQLFQPFNRLGQEGGGEEGTGIGLVVARRLVELMGGMMGVESAVGVGSVFWFELDSVGEPIHVVEESGAAALAAPRPLREVRQHTVLYVEDNPANLKLVQQIIGRHAGIRLLTAIDGLTGIAIARASQPDVILMDINLPGIGGFEALKLLRADPATAHILVIAVSANAMPLDVELGLKAGFFRYLTKPINVGEFNAALDLALDSTQDAVSPVS